MKKSLIVFALAFLASSSVQAAGKIVVSQIYGGGGNAGANYKNDFIELHNVGDAAVSVAGWSVQYASAAGTSWQTTPLSGSIQPGYYYLVQEGVGAGGTVNLPTPDATGNINMSATAGKVLLANATTAQSGSQPVGAQIIDFVGFGTTANAFEGPTGPTPAPSNTTSVQRKDNGSQDQDNNANDFTAGAPVPRNGASSPYLPASTATQIRVETLADGSGTVVPAQTVGLGNSITAYAIFRDAGGAFVTNGSATWSLLSKTGGVADGDLVASGDGKSAVFTGNLAGSAVIHAASASLSPTDSGTLTVTAASSSPSGTGNANPGSTAAGQTVLLTVTVVPGVNPTSTGLAVIGDLSSVGGTTNQPFYDDGTHGDVNPGDNVFSYQMTTPSNLAGGLKTIPISIQDAQIRSGSAFISFTVRGDLTIFHENDTHARVTPYKWIIPQHTTNTQTQFEDVGGAAYLGGKMIDLVTGKPDALVLDGGDISEGNPVGDWNGPPSPVGVFGNGTIVEFYKLMDTKLRAIPGRGGRGLDAMVVGNHDIRDISYLDNMKNQTNFPVISINICIQGTHTPYFQPYVILNVNGNKIGIVGYTTESADSPEDAVNTNIDVVHCDWSSSDSSKIHFADYVNELRNTQGCNLVILLTHDGHSDLCTSDSGGSTPILVDNAVAKVPEIAVTGHWHTWAETVWQPSILNYKTIFTEASCFMHYIGELRVNGLGKYITNANYVLRDADITPDPDIAALIQTRKDEYAATSPQYGLDQVIGYTADDLLLDNKFKWWSCDEFPWSGANTAGNWICDGVQWKAIQIFGQCDLSVQSGGGVRSDIPAGPVTYTHIYETYPWADDVIYLVNMTGSEIVNYIKKHGCDVGLSQGWLVTAFDGNPTSVTYNGQPIDLSHTYKVAINNFMYLHDTVPFSDPSPQISTNLARTALVEYTAQYPQGNPYQAGGSRYNLNTDFSGGYRAVITMMNDADAKTYFDDAFIRFLDATPETLAHRGTKQVPTSLINADGTVIQSNRLAEIELYRSFLGFRTNVLHPGDIIETWGKGGFFGGDPEFVDQEGIYSDGVEFKIVGHDDNLAQPNFVPDILTVVDDWHKNHYLRFLARKTGASTVTDQNGTSLPVYDVTGFSAKSLPGNVGDLLLLTGVPTSESFSMRFRCGSAVLASSAGFTGFPPTSRVDAVAPSEQAAPSLHLTAQASAFNSSQGNASLAPVADAEVARLRPTSNFGTGTSIFIQSAASGSFGDERGWLKFDLNGLSLPVGATVTNVQLKFWCWNASTVASLPVEVRGSLTDSWAEASLTWGNQPAFGSALGTNVLASGVQNLWYYWDVTGFATNELAGDHTATFVLKPVAEGATTETSYGFDAKEFQSGANSPALEFHYTQPGTSNQIAQVQFQFRYSTDSSTWTGWSNAVTVLAPPWAADFHYPNGIGYYEFRSIATDSDGNIEPAPQFADTAVHYNGLGGNGSSAASVNFNPRSERPSPTPVFSICNTRWKCPATWSTGCPWTFSARIRTGCFSSWTGTPRTTRAFSTGPGGIDLSAPRRREFSRLFGDYSFTMTIGGWSPGSGPTDVGDAEFSGRVTGDFIAAGAASICVRRSNSSQPLSKEARFSLMRAASRLTSRPASAGEDSPEVLFVLFILPNRVGSVVLLVRTA